MPADERIRGSASPRGLRLAGSVLKANNSRSTVRKVVLSGPKVGRHWGSRTME
jgi:hypothetical protein